MKREISFEIQEGYLNAIRLYLKGDLGVVQFCLLVEQMKNPPPSLVPLSKNLHHIMASDLGVHSIKPMYPNQSFTGKKDEACLAFKGTINEGKQCYYDGSSLVPIELWEKVLKEGDDELIWQKMEEWYDSQLAGDEPSVRQDEMTVDEIEALARKLSPAGLDKLLRRLGLKQKEIANQYLPGYDLEEAMQERKSIHGG